MARHPEGEKQHPRQFSRFEESVDGLEVGFLRSMGIMTANLEISHARFIIRAGDRHLEMLARQVHKVGGALIYRTDPGMCFSKLLPDVRVRQLVPIPILEPVVQRAVITLGGQPVETEDEEEEGLKPLPERLVIELTAHRTLALRDAVASNPHIAMTMLLHKLVSDAFRYTAPTGCLEASVRHLYFSIQSEDMKESLSAQAQNDRHERWGDHVPADDQALWDWLDAPVQRHPLSLPPKTLISAGKLGVIDAQKSGSQRTIECF